MVFMNKKIWIGLASIFLILILVLGIQMLNEEDQPVLNSDQVEESQVIPNQEDGGDRPTSINKNNQTSGETSEVETPLESEETEDEIKAESDKPIESGSSAEEPAQTQEPQPIPSPGQKEPSPMFVTLSVSVKTLLDKEDLMNQEKLELLPADGYIFPAQKVEFYEGESAFNVLLREMKKNKIHMEYVMTPIYNSNYIEGIGNIYEFDCGELSGWMYSINDESPNLGTTNYILKDKDVVKVLYTCDLGRDLGFAFNE